MFVGESGIARIIERTCQIMREHNTDDVRRFGVIDLPTLQRYLNFHYTVSLDLFGQELSTNAANYYTMGLKGRFRESELDDDHILEHAHYKVPELVADSIQMLEAPALTALNERLRDDYIADSEKGVERWNRLIRKHEIPFRLHLPHRGFHRQIGAFAGASITPTGEIVSAPEWERHREQWLPSAADRAYVASLMTKAVLKPGQMANWIAAPARGIDGQPIDFEYVRFH